MRWPQLAFVALQISCRATGVFTCEQDSQCARAGSMARCEIAGYCSFDDSACSSGWRYDEHAEDGYAGQCVGMEPVDASVDTVPVDALMQAPGCPTGYYVISGQSGGYRYVTTQADWLTAEQDCDDDGSGTHLVIVTGGNERDALKQFLPLSEPTVWLGITDRITEGAYRSVLDVAQTYLPWDNLEPTATTAQNCLVLNEENFRDESCTSTEEYVCECDGNDPVTSSY